MIGPSASRPITNVKTNVRLLFVMRPGKTSSIAHRVPREKIDAIPSVRVNADVIYATLPVTTNFVYRIQSYTILYTIFH